MEKRQGKTFACKFLRMSRKSTHKQERKLEDSCAKVPMNEMKKKKIQKERISFRFVWSMSDGKQIFEK